MHNLLSIKQVCNIWAVTQNQLLTARRIPLDVRVAHPAPFADVERSHWRTIASCEANAALWRASNSDSYPMGPDAA